MSTPLLKLMLLANKLVKTIAVRVLERSDIQPRHFSNKMLRKYAPGLKGRVINISGWKDEDGDGGHYRDYFSNVSDYSISNIKGQLKGLGSAGDSYEEIELDLLAEIPEELNQAYDVVYNHTTLEHVFDFQAAFRHLCELSSDIVIIVVPVMQQIHQTGDFGDYWRPTTMTIARLFMENGFEPLVVKCNDQPFAPVYCFAIGTRKPEKHSTSIPKDIDYQMGRYNYGATLQKEGVETVLRNTVRKD